MISLFFSTKVVCHDLVDLDLLVDSSGHDLFVDGLI